MSEERERALDDALRSGEQPADPDVASLVGGAEALRRHLAVPAPDAARERAIFVHGAAARRTSFLPLRFVMPAAIVVSGLVAVVGFGRTALPGQTLYPVREALASVGLARTAEEDIDRRLTSARENLAEARSTGLGDPRAAQALVLAAIGDLERARTLTEDLPRDDRAALLVTIGNLEERAVDMLVRIDEGPEAEDEGEEPGEDNSGPGSDNSGPGSENSGSDDSGSGSDDEGGDDNSGSGSDDSDDDDDSGSGSDDSGDDDSGSGGDDSSGSGSDDSGSRGDNSGSGSDDSGSGGSG